MQQNCKKGLCLAFLFSAMFLTGWEIAGMRSRQTKETAAVAYEAGNWGLGFGADSYLTKPFHLDELAARIRSLTLRCFTQNDVVLSCGNLLFDTKLRKASVSGDNLTLTRKETEILEYLILNQGRPISQEEFLEHVWDSSIDDFSNSIRVHISSLRKKLRAALGYDPIHNRIGEGYVMENKK